MKTKQFKRIMGVFLLSMVQMGLVLLNSTPTYAATIVSKLPTTSKPNLASIKKRLLSQGDSIPTKSTVNGQLTPNANTIPGPLVQLGGLMMHSAHIHLIFWEPPNLQDGTPATVATNYNSSIIQFYQDLASSNTMATNFKKIATQYWDNTNGHFSGTITFDPTNHGGPLCQDTKTN